MPELLKSLAALDALFIKHPNIRITLSLQPTMWKTKGHNKHWIVAELDLPEGETIEGENSFACAHFCVQDSLVHLQEMHEDLVNGDWPTDEELEI